MIRELQDEGLLAQGKKKRVRPMDSLPGVAVLEITAVDDDGDLLAAPVADGQPEEGPAAPRVHMQDGGPGRAPKIGDRILARLTRLDGLTYEGRVIKILPRPPERLIGVLEQTRNGLVVRPLDRKAGPELRLDPAEAGEAGPGELVAVERLRARPLVIGRAKVVERLGHVNDAGAVSLLAAYQYDLRTVFPPEVLEAADLAAPVGLERRADLRHLPLVTIDGADARDFDDAVCARPDDHPDNPGGWQIVVAIADVAHYVRPGSLLDLEARARGNSTYFPDRVLPMLPEALSNGLCSLRPGEDRACLAVHIGLDRAGKLRRHRFERALMRSRARLTYEQLQAARDGRPDDHAAPWLEPVIQPLYGAFSALLHARRQRGTLDLDLPELKLELDDKGRPSGIAKPPRLDAHRLIEEFMIAANVAAAETLERKATPCMHRVHDGPDATKLEGLGQLLKSLGIIRQSALGTRPKDLARLLETTREHPLGPLISTLLLRAQSQAVYSPRNIGHYGLNLGRYAHFTSPIRRYADLIVHRGLIRALKLGQDGLPDDTEIDGLHELGSHISGRERRSMEAERHAKDRFVALLMADRIGSVFAGRVTSAHRFGLFVQLTDSLADLLVPISTLSANRLEHDAAHHALIDARAGVVWALGDPVEVELAEVDTATGRLGGRLVGHAPGQHAQGLLKGRGRTQKKRGRRR